MIIFCSQDLYHNSILRNNYTVQLDKEFDSRGESSSRTIDSQLEKQKDDPFSHL